MSKEFVKSVNLIQVSAQKAVFPYIEVAKRMVERGEDELLVAGLGISVVTVASVVDMLTNAKFFTVTNVHTGRGEIKGARDTVPSLSIRIKKSADFDKLWADELATRKDRKERK